MNTAPFSAMTAMTAVAPPPAALPSSPGTAAQPGSAAPDLFRRTLVQARQPAEASSGAADRAPAGDAEAAPGAAGHGDADARAARLRNGAGHGAGKGAPRRGEGPPGTPSGVARTAPGRGEDSSGTTGAAAAEAATANAVADGDDVAASDDTLPPAAGDALIQTLLATPATPAGDAAARAGLDPGARARAAGDLGDGDTSVPPLPGIVGDGPARTRASGLQGGPDGAGGPGARSVRDGAALREDGARVGGTASEARGAAAALDGTLPRRVESTDTARGDAGLATSGATSPSAGAPAAAAAGAAAVLGMNASPASGPSPAFAAPGAAPTEARLASGPGQPDFAPAFGAQISVLLRDGVQVARVQLHPAELGPVTVQIALDGQQAQLHLAAEQAPTRQALEQALPVLAGTLREAGFTLAGGGVFEQPRQDRAPDDARGSGGAAGDRDESGRDTAATVAAPIARRRGVVDLVA